MKEFFLGFVLTSLFLAGWTHLDNKTSSQFTIPGKTFDLDVVVVIEKDVDKAYQVVRGIDTTATIDDFDARGVTFTNGSSIVVWMPKVEDQIVSHELLHATVAIMNWAGVPLTDQTEEVYAYQLQYLTNEFYKHQK
jgi:hypothetical protein